MLRLVSLFPADECIIGYIKYSGGIMATRDFKKRVISAAADTNLNTALERATGAYAKSREAAFAGYDIDALRERLRECKETSLNSIPELFERFKKEAEAVSVKVHEASGAVDTCRIVGEIAREHGVRSVVKSKSMVTEEIELNKYLISLGIEVTETDLGEWVCQLAGERPSNLTIPAIHKTREQVAEIFSKAVGEKVPSDIPSLVAVARKQIRQKFIEADMGISGANIAIADTGSIVIVSNEGNARLVTSLPDVHVAVVSYDKLVPSIDETTAVLKMLSKSGTGQKMTSYVSFITGPSRTSDIEKTLTLGCHGPKEMHVVFVDNGRKKLLADKDFREALYCIKCGACLSVCPVYRSVGGHVFGHLYFGGIGAVLEAFLSGLESAENLADICSTCGRCKSYCPSGIDVPGMIAKLRSRIAEKKGQPLVQRLILQGVLGSPERFDSAMKLSRSMQQIFLPNSKEVPNLPAPVSRYTGFRSLPLLASKPLSETVPERTLAVGTKRGTVAFFPGCVIENIYPEIGLAVVENLSRLGWDVHLPKGQGCCGIPALLKGDEKTAQNLAAHNVQVEGMAEVDYVITACPTCSKALREDFVRLLSGSSSEDASAGLSKKTMDFSEFLVKVCGVSQEQIENAGQGIKITYHDPCHARHGLGIVGEPRELLSMAGYNICEMQNPDACCGFAGSFTIAYPEVSKSMLKRKLESVKSTGTGLLATDCPGCLMQLRGGIEKAGINIRAAHTAELVQVRREGSD
jgi:iron-sulfur cluster protein